jgi:hypothetical protein
VKGYHVPDFLLTESKETSSSKTSNGQQASKKRDNPDPIKLNSPEPEQNATDETSKKEELVDQNPPPVTHVDKSILPKDQDYMRTAGIVSLTPVLKKALDKDTVQNRVVITSISGAIGAIIGGAALDSAAGALIGAGLGLGSAWLTYWFVDRNEQTGFQPKPQKQLPQKKQESTYVKGVESMEYEYV